MKIGELRTDTPIATKTETVTGRRDGHPIEVSVCVGALLYAGIQSRTLSWMGGVEGHAVGWLTVPSGVCGG